MISNFKSNVCFICGKHKEAGIMRTDKDLPLYQCLCSSESKNSLSFLEAEKIIERLQKIRESEIDNGNIFSSLQEISFTIDNIDVHVIEDSPDMSSVLISINNKGI